MSAPRLRIAALLAALVLPVAGCGSGGEGLLSQSQAKKLRTELEDARRAVDDDPQRCRAARAAAQRGSARAAALPAKVDRKLQKNLQTGFNRLVDRVNEECGRDRVPKKTPTPEATPTPTVTAEPTAEPTVTAEPTPTPTPTPEPTPEPTVTVDPTVTPDAPDTGDTSAEGVRQVGNQ